MKRINKYQLVILMLFLSKLAYAENVITPRFSSVSWDNNTFTLSGNQLVFKKDNTNAIGAEYNYVFDNGLAVGGEILFQEWKVQSDTGGSFAGDANVYHANVIGKYIFLRDGSVQPYVSLGVGVSRISVHSSTDVILRGHSYQGAAGISFILSNKMGLSLGYKKGYVSVDDDPGNEIKSHTDTLQLGLDIKF